MKIKTEYYRIPQHVVDYFEVPKRGKPYDESLFQYPQSKDSRKLFSINWQPYIKGGKVVCTIIDRDNVFTGVSICSMADNFSYKIGRRIALGRALKLLNES